MRCQQFQLYAAEDRVPRGRVFSTVEEIQAWVDGLRDTWWWPVFYPQVLRVEVYRRDARKHESVGWYEAPKRAGAIELLPCHWNEREVLHELAHVLAAARANSRAHDPAFARIYLELVYHAMGSEAYYRLWDAFTRDGIQHTYEEPGRLGLARQMAAAS